MYQNVIRAIVERLDAIGQPRSLVSKRHGSPYDRGSADAWYDRGCNPHYYVGATMQSPKVTEADMTTQEILEYELGYYEGMDSLDHKEW